MQAWGNINSRMLGTYAHLSNADMDRVLLSRAGITTKEPKKDDALKPRQCSHCGEINSPTFSFCSQCGRPLTDSARHDVENTGDTLRELLVKNPAAQAELMALLAGDK